MTYGKRHIDITQKKEKEIFSLTNNKRDKKSWERRSIEFR